MRLSQCDSFFLYDKSMKIPNLYWTPIGSQAMANALLNGLSYQNKTSIFQLKRYMKDIIDFDHFTTALMKLADQVHARMVRIVVCTLTPCIGFKLFKFTLEMEMLRKQINEWIRSCDDFDEISDMDAVIRDSKHPNFIDARYLQGDHLHPNRVGGQKIADAFDLVRLMGRELSS